MAKIIQFKQVDFFMFHKSRFQQTISRLNQTLENPNIKFEEKLEAKMLKSIFEFNDQEFDRTSSLIEKMRDKKIKFVE